MHIFTSETICRQFSSSLNKPMVNSIAIVQKFSPIILILKGLVVSIISGDLPFLERHVRFTTISLNL